MYIAENLKALRKGKGFTQEEAAEILNVSPQSVSKWERGDTYPDITLLPVLANLYKVSVDEIIGMDKINDAQVRTAIFKKGHEFLRLEDYAAAETVFSESLKTYPNDESFMTELGMALALSDDPAKLRQAISLCEKALAGSPGEKLRHTARAALSFMYFKTGEKDKATWIAESLPHIRESREHVLAQFDKNPPDINTYLRFIILGERHEQDIIAIEFHENMVPMCLEYDLLGKIKKLREELKTPDGDNMKKLPPVRIRDNIHLPPSHVRVRHYADYVLEKSFTDMNNAVSEILSVLRKIVLDIP
ncbi:MAG: helix-turn-helix domain-containing protein [Defluviitaleaceae bacterium]|nr:helix-turn-helix domain-containing protein [Defluviitaleaceae bacterium]